MLRPGAVFNWMATNCTRLVRCKLIMSPSLQGGANTVPVQCARPGTRCLCTGTKGSRQLHTHALHSQGYLITARTSSSKNSPGKSRRKSCGDFYVYLYGRSIVFRLAGSFQCAAHRQARRHSWDWNWCSEFADRIIKLTDCTKLSL